MVEALLRLVRDGQLKADTLRELLKEQSDRPTYHIDKLEGAEGANFGPDYSKDKKIDGKEEGK